MLQNLQHSVGVWDLFLRNLLVYFIVMSMGPESTLFPQYEQQLDHEIAEQQIQARLLAALNAIDNVNQTSRDVRTMLDAYEVETALRLSSVPDGRRIGGAVYTPVNDLNPKGALPTATLSPGFDHFERGGIPCATYAAKLNPVDNYSQYSVYRVVLATTAQKTLPDCRGIYVARGPQDSVLTIFRIFRQPRGRLSVSAGEHVIAAEAITGEARLPVIEELEKAAAVIPEPPARRHRPGL
jgi:hypothetical protein